MATHSGILAWKIPRTEKPGGLQSMDGKKSDTTVSSTPLQCLNVWRDLLENNKPFGHQILMGPVHHYSKFQCLHIVHNQASRCYQNPLLMDCSTAARDSSGGEKLLLSTRT